MSSEANSKFREVKKETYGILLNIQEITHKLMESLKTGNLDEILDKVKKRGELIKQIEDNRFSIKSDDKKNQNLLSDKNSRPLRALVDSIRTVDKKNQELLKQKMENTSKSLTVLAKKRKAVENLQSISKNNRAPIVNFLH
jgi:hypothetical protein